MESSTRIILGLAILAALRLGYKMRMGRAGRGSLLSRTGSTRARTVIIAILGPVLAWQLLLPDSLPNGLVMDTPGWLEANGLALFISGAILRTWSQITLGDNWSADLSTRPRHELLETGPYALLRHPIYASYILIAPGLMFTTGNWLIGALALAYTLVSQLRIPEEDAMLCACFGERHLAYRSIIIDRRNRIITAAVAVLNLCGAGHELSWLLGW